MLSAWQDTVTASWKGTLNLQSDLILSILNGQIEPQYGTTGMVRPLCFHCCHLPRIDVFTLFYFILFYFILFYFILFYFILFCFVLFCFVLFCFVLFCFVLFYSSHSVWACTCSAWTSFIILTQAWK